ncbi:MAG: hypothetical protein QME68_06535 [Elusimicrobiota bacterium]|nr:hypothetical protein [Elusimicrobiota bacterium]
MSAYISAWFFHILYVKKIGIDVLNTDRCGGLSSIGNLYLKFSLFFALMISVFFVAKSIERQTYQPYQPPPYFTDSILIIGAIISVLLFFLLPQLAFYKILSKAKKDKLENLQEKLKIASKLEVEVDSNQAIFILLYISFINEIKKMRSLPFETKTFKEAIIISLIPTLGKLYEYVYQFVRS